MPRRAFHRNCAEENVISMPGRASLRSCAEENVISMCAGLPIEVAQRKMLSQCRAGLPIEIVQRKMLSQCQAGLPIDILLMKKSRIKCRTEASFIVPEFTTSLYGSSCRKKILLWFLFPIYCYHQIKAGGMPEKMEIEK